MIEITLTTSELRYAGHAGVERQIAALERQRCDQFAPRDYWATHVLSSMAELAVAKWRGRYWVPFRDQPSGHPDVGIGEVRSSPNPSTDLILRPRDRGKGDAPFVLVVTAPPIFRIVGWAYGREAMLDEFWRSAWDPPAWAMPQDRLREVAA